MFLLRVDHSTARPWVVWPSGPVARSGRKFFMVIGVFILGIWFYW